MPENQAQFFDLCQFNELGHIMACQRYQKLLPQIGIECATSIKILPNCGKLIFLSYVFAKQAIFEYFSVQAAEYN